VKHPSITSWSDAYVALKRHLEDARGFVESQGARFPRATGDDVLLVAAILDRPLRAAPLVHGSTHVLARWRQCLDDVARYAIADPAETYVEGATFWPCALDVCVHLDAAEVEPPEPAVWSGLLVELGATRARNAGAIERGPLASIDDAATYDEMYIAQYRYLRDKRGSDVMDQPTAPVAGHALGGGRFAVPRTTNSDVLQLAAYWTHVFADARGVLDDHDAVTAQWKAVVVDVDRLAKGADPSARYPQNNVLWRVMDDVATEVSTAARAPTRWDLFVGALEHSIRDLPENLAKEARWLGEHAKDLVVRAADAAGSAASSALRPLVGSLTTPLLVGGGVLGIWLLARNRGEETT
jgi:hypothetical protein